MRQALPKLDFKKLEQPEFSHGETLQITGLTADTLLTWHKRGAVPAILGTFMLLRYTEHADEIDALPSLILVAYEDDAGKIRFEVFTSKEGQGLPVIPASGIEKWMRSLNIQSATILNIV